MSNKKFISCKTGLWYGLYTGCIFIILHVVLQLLNINMTSNINFLIYIAPLIGIYYAMKKLNLQSNEKTNISAYIKTGMIVAVITGLAKGIFYFFYLSFFNTTILDERMHKFDRSLKNADLPADKTESLRSIAELILTPEMMPFIYLTEFLIIGLIFSIILANYISIFYENKNKNLS